MKSRRVSMWSSRFSGPRLFRSTRRTATVTISAPDASWASFMTWKLGYLPVPTMRRERNSRPARIRGSPLMLPMVARTAASGGFTPPPPTKVTISRWSPWFRRSVACSARGTTRRLCSTATRARSSESWRRRSATVEPEGTRNLSPLTETWIPAGSVIRGLPGAGRPSREIGEDQIVEGEVFHHGAFVREVEAAALDLHDHALVLVFNELRDGRLVPPVHEVRVGQAPRAEDLAALVDERLDEGVGRALVLGLDVVHDALVFNVGVEAGNHRFKRGALRAPELRVLAPASSSSSASSGVPPAEAVRKPSLRALQRRFLGRILGPPTRSVKAARGP